MELKPDFSFRPVPAITTPLTFVLPATDSNLGPLRQLPGTWTGTGFNVIWRPNSTPGQDRFLELNLTTETLQFQEISGPIPNRGLVQPDINMFGVTYLQQISDTNNKAGLHIEPGIWATVPVTSNPLEGPTVVRMASIPHGTTILCQGTALAVPGGPRISPADITPFTIGNAAKKVPFGESNLANPALFRSPPADIVGITQAMVDNPNSVLSSAIAGQNITQTIVLLITSDPTAPVVGDGLANTAFLQGTPSAGPNAQTAQVTAIFWIETVQDPVTGSSILQLQYTQTVLLNFNGLSWPHITVGTLQRARNPAQPTISTGDGGDAVRRLQRALRRTGNLAIAVNGIFDAPVEAAVEQFQTASGLKADSIVGPLTWAALPDGGPMPTLQLGSTGAAVTSLQTVLTNGAPGQWATAPQAITGTFGPDTQASVQALQTWGGVPVDGIVGDATWSVSMQAAGATLESKVGLNFVAS